MEEIKRNVLLNPGPATTTDTVKMAQVVPDICPREKKFGDVLEWISKELTHFVVTSDADADYTSILFGGSGTAGIESVISSVSGKILIVNNGAYGKRMCEIANAYDIDMVEFLSSPIKPIEYSNLEKELENGDFQYLAVVHNETTTGLLNNLAVLGSIAKKYNVELIVDAMSSFGAIDIDMEEDNVSFLVASSNKNIQGMAGIVFVIADKHSLQKLKNNTPRNYYLNLYAQYEHFVKTHQMRFTPPVQTLYALKQAIVEAKEEGIKNRYKRYNKSWLTLTKGLKQLGLRYLVDDDHHSRIITSIFMPDAINFDDMHDYFYENGFTIYPGKVKVFNTFRVANIGAIDYRDIKQFLKLLHKILL